MTAPEPSTAAASPLVELRGATVGYPDRPILRAVDLEVRRGDFLAIIGPNGAGKTTVLRTILGVLPPLAGTCVARGRLGYAPQRSSLDPVFPFTSAEVVAMGLLGGAPRPDAAGLVARALAACGMAAQTDTPFRDLSGGQKQRVLVARALVSEPDVLVLDEPTNDLDLRGEHDVMELVRSLHEGGRTVVMVSHLLHVVARYAKRMAFIREGTLVTGDTDGMLTPEKLEPLYGMPVVVGEVAGHKAVAPGSGPATKAPEPPPGESARTERPSVEREPGHGLDDSRAGKESRRAAARARREAAREAHEAEKRAEAERRAAAAALAASQPSAPATPAPSSPSRGGPGPETRAAWARAAMNPGPWPWAALILTALSLFAAWRVGREVDAREAVEKQLADQAEQHLAATKAASEREVDLGYELGLARTHGNALAEQERDLQEQLARAKAALAEAEAGRDAAALERDSRMAGLVKLEGQLAEVTSRGLVLDAERKSLERQVAAAKADKEAGDTLLRGIRQQIADLEGKQVELEAEKEELEAEAKEGAEREAALQRQLADEEAAVKALRQVAQGLERSRESANEVRELLGATRVEVVAERPASLPLRAADSLALAGRGECVLAFVVDGGSPGLELTLVAGERTFPLPGQPVGPSSARWYVVVPSVAGELARADELTLRVASREPLTLTSVRLLATRLPTEPADLLDQLQRARAPRPEQPPGDRGF